MVTRRIIPLMPMKMHKIALFAVAAVCALPLFAGPQKPGKWQMTMQTEMANMPMKIPPYTTEVCVTPEQAAKPEPPKSPRNNDCKFSDYKIEGNTVSWTMTCEKQKLTGEGKITYSADSYEGQMHAKMGDMEVTTKYSGKRLGDCDK